MVGAEHLPDDFVGDVRRYKYRGSSGKVNLALDALPDFTCLPGAGRAPARRDLDFAERRLHGARLRRREVRPLLAAAVHRHGDSEPDRSVGRAAGKTRHVVLRAVRAVPPQGRQLGRRSARRSATRSSTRSPSTRRTSTTSSCTGRSLTPLDIERDFGLTEGNIFQGELTLEQLFFLRPAPGWAQYRTPIRNLYMCGSATHPGGGIMGAPGRNAAMRILKETRQETGDTRQNTEVEDRMETGEQRARRIDRLRRFEELSSGRRASGSFFACTADRASRSGSFGLASQMRRAAVSVRRTSPKDSRGAARPTRRGF